MKVIRLFFLALFCATTLLSCKKDDENQNPTPQPEPVTPTYDNYSALKVGNYWIYEYFDVDSLGNATSRNMFDSCYVKNDTIINGKTYFNLVQPSSYFTDPTIYPQAKILRDSLHYIVSSRGSIRFSSEDFTTVFDERTRIISPWDTVDVIKKMESGLTVVSTPAGAFTTLNVKTAYDFYPTSNYKDGAEHVRYAKNVGLVIETMPMYAMMFNTGHSVEKRLIRYHVQP